MGGQNVSVVVVTIVTAVSFMAMILLQFYTGMFRDGVLKEFIVDYYQHFNNVRNVISGLFYCSIGGLIVYLDKFYHAVWNKILLVVSVVAAYGEFLYVTNHGICKEEYSTAFLSLVYVFLILEAMHLEWNVKCGTFLRKASNVIYFQHRYLLILWAVCYKMSGLEVFNNNICQWCLTVTASCALTALYMKLRQTRCNKLIKFLY